MFDEGAYDTAERAGALGPLQDDMFAVHLIGLASGERQSGPPLLRQGEREDVLVTAVVARRRLEGRIVELPMMCSSDMGQLGDSGREGHELS